MHIYKYTNIVNGKVYIGKSVRPDGVREQEHIYQAKCGIKKSSHFYNAIRKYGADAFTVEVIHRAKTNEELSVMETFFIVLHQSYKPENGYNGTLGGDGMTLPSDETRQNVSAAKKGKRPLASDLNRGKKHSSKRKAEISAFFKTIPRSESWKKHISESLRGKQYSEERRHNISESKKKLTTDQLNEIRSLRAVGFSYAKLAPRFGVTPSAIWYALRRTG